VLQLQRPEGLAPLIAEVDASRTAFAATRDSSAAPLLDDHDGLYAWLSSSGAAGTPLLTSTIQEALRFCSSSFSIRLVTRDTSLAGYTLYKDQKVICMTRAVHLDEEVHEDSAEFVPTRYLDANKARTKDGKSVPNHTLPFGGGVSMCEGRYASLLCLSDSQLICSGV
jgi:cytochrome P450